MECAEAFAEILSLIPESKTALIRVEGGHYQIGAGPTDISLSTFRIMIDFYLQLVPKCPNVTLEVLINDMGMPAALRHESREQFELPGTYEQLLAERHIPKGLVKIRFEKNVKNRAAVFTKKQSFREVATKGSDGRWRYDSYDLGTAIALTNETGVPQCTLLMGQMFYDIGSSYAVTINFYSAQVRATMERASVIAQELYQSKCRIINCYVAARTNSILGVYTH